MTTLKITQIGNSLGVVLPKEMLAQLHVDKGDVLYATPVQGGFSIHAYNPEFVEDMEMAERLIKENRNILKKLAQ